MLYHPLDYSKREIRLIQITTAARLEDPLQFTISIIALDTAPEYLALSYVWGDPSDVTDVTINGEVTPITNNLALALRHLRETFKRRNDQGFSIENMPTTVWADAISINQTDIDERSHQVQLMRDIYTRASIVISWLGEDGDGEMDLAMKTIEVISYNVLASENSLNDLEWLRQYPWLVTKVGAVPGQIPNKAWAALRSFCKKDYWQRIWILQETVVARSLWIMSGLRLLDFACFKQFDDLHGVFIAKDASHILDTELYYHLAQPQALRSGFCAITAGFRGEEYIHTAPVKDDGAKLRYYFLATIRYLASDPRDKIFAIQGLLGEVVKPDYEASVAEVYILFAKSWIEHSTLDIIVLADESQETTSAEPLGLPSWVPDWQFNAIATTWRPAYYGNSGFCSSRGLESVCKQPPRITKTSYLEVEGCVCDVVETIAELHLLLSIENFIEEFWAFCWRYIKRTAPKAYPSGITPLQACLILFLSGHNPWDSKKPLGEQDSIRAFLPFGFDQRRDKWQELLTEMGSNMNAADIAFLQNALVESETWAGEFWPDEDLAMIMAHLRTHFESECAVFWTSEGYIGLSSNAVRAGDKVSVLNTLSTPTVLRKKASHHMHVGACFVVGLMDGEAAGLIEEGKLCIQDFEIR
jgi:hypothetical protein